MNIVKSIITSPYAVKSRSLPILLQQANPSLSVKYVERFKPIAPFLVRNIFLVAYRGDRSDVYETVGPGVVLASFRSGSLGLASTTLVAMSLIHGEPTLLYKDTHRYVPYSDVTAEWWSEPFLSGLPKRLVEHASMYCSAPLPMQDVERQAEEYLSRWSNRTPPTMYRRRVDGAAEK